MYLVQISEENKIVECDTFEEVKSLLFRACVLWVYSEDYCGEDLDTPEKLFNSCMENQDFGDIAQVLEIHTYFTAPYGLGNHTSDKITCNIMGCDLRTPFKCQRIL